MTYVQIDLIDPNPFQLRETHDEEMDRALQESIEKNGLIQPLVVRPHPDKPGRFQLVCGERRLRACRALERPVILVSIKELEDKQMVELLMEENLQREDLNPLEEALCYRWQKKLGSTEYEIACKYGRSRPYIANRLRLLDMDVYLIHCVLAKTLQPWQALMIEKTPKIKKYLLADYVIDWQVTFEELREAIKRIGAGAEDIRITRMVKVEALQVLDQEFYKCDSSTLEKLMSKGDPPFLVSAYVDGEVRLGHLAVIVARKLGWDKLKVELVFPVEWLSNDTAPVSLCSDLTAYSNSLFPDRTDEQRSASTRLNQRIKGQEERFPMLVVESPQIDTPDHSRARRGVVEGIPILPGNTIGYVRPDPGEAGGHQGEVRGSQK